MQFAQFMCPVSINVAYMNACMLQVRNFYVGKDFKGDPPLSMKIAAGLTTGALAISVASPTDLVKVCV